MEGVRATGANPLEVVLYGVIPQVLPLWISYSLYRFESNVRSASVVGMVGAGGADVQIAQERDGHRLIGQRDRLPLLAGLLIEHHPLRLDGKGPYILGPGSLLRGDTLHDGRLMLGGCILGVAPIGLELVAGGPAKRELDTVQRAAEQRGDLALALVLLGQGADELFKSSDPALLINLKQSLAMAEPLVDRALTLSRMTHNVTINFSATPLLINDQVKEILVELQQVDNLLRISKEEQILTQQNTARLLVRGLAHEIKNPLGGLRGAAQLLDLELHDPDLKEYTQIIIAESDRLQGLMDKMLGPNKLPNKKALNIHEVLERVRQLVQAESSGSLTIKNDYDPSIPDIHADKDQLIQAILNIARNAVQAMEGKGNIIFKTRIHRHMSIGRKRYKLAVKCDIIDNGPGIGAAMMSQIFYPMFTGRAEGTGLGLSIAQALINQHNGLIECNSEPGNTVFSIFLPMEAGND